MMGFVDFVFTFSDWTFCFAGALMEVDNLHETRKGQVCGP